ncbi:sensor histidine kinase [Longimicrobium sp.]|uniref:sensor histidine kinase n=1 Tax=Longimicrobium sp. TaxID=2029185 RepID=UPI003B3B7822
MSSEIQSDGDMGVGDALPTQEREAVALITSLTDADRTDVRRDVRLTQLGAMVAIVVHDLKQYISVVSGVSELLREGLISAEKASMLLRANADSMTRMAQEILEFTRGVSEVALTRVPVPSLVAPLNEVVLCGLEGRGIRVHRRIRSAGSVMCDPDLLLRALVNLITNAGEAMPNGGDLALTIEDTRDAVVFGIQDTGAGIAEDILPSIFEPFITHGKRGGTGLGLAITRDIVHAHGGSIGVASTVGRGTTFIVTIPRPEPELPSVTPAAMPAPP